MASILSQLGVPKTRWHKSHLADVKKITQADTFQYGADATTVATLLGSGKRAAKSRSLIYEKWSIMEADAICSSALMLLVTTALGGHETSGQMVFIEKSPEAEQNKKLEKIVNEIADDLSDLFNKVAFSMGYTGSAFGDAYARVYADKNGVIDLYTDEMVRAPLVQPFERGSRTVGSVVYIGPRNFERLDITQLARLKMPRTQWVPQNGVVEKSLRLALTEDNLDNLPLMPSMAGGSLLYNAEESYDNLAASLMGLVGQRWMDSIDESMLTINLDSMTKEQQTAYTNSVVSMLKKSKELAESAIKGGKPIMERIRHIIPIFNEKQLTQINTDSQQSGRKGSIDIDDVILHARLLSGALGVDLAMLGFADQLSGGLGDGGFFRVSAQAAERSRVIRVALSDFFNNIIDIHTLKRYGVVFPANKRPWQINFYGSISSLEAEKQRTKADSMNSGMILVQVMQSLKDAGATKEMMKSFLSKQMMLDEDEANLFAEIVAAKDEGDMGEVA